MYVLFLKIHEKSTIIDTFYIVVLIDKCVTRNKLPQISNILSKVPSCYRRRKISQNLHLLFFTRSTTLVINSKALEK